jgi:hypothetical protein
MARWTRVKQRAAHRHSPPPVFSDGWGGHREALIELYGQVPPDTGRGRPPTRKHPGADWHDPQMVKPRDGTGNLIGMDRRVIYGDDTPLERTGTRTTGVEPTNLSSRQMNGRLVRKTLGYSKPLEMLKAACAWEEGVYNFARSVKPLRCAINIEGKRWLQASPAMAAGLTDHIWSIRELLLLVPLPTNSI